MIDVNQTTDNEQTRAEREALRPGLEWSAKWHSDQVCEGHCGEAMDEMMARQRSNRHHIRSADAICAEIASLGDPTIQRQVTIRPLADLEAELGVKGGPAVFREALRLAKEAKLATAQPETGAKRVTDEVVTSACRLFNSFKARSDTERMRAALEAVWPTRPSAEPAPAPAVVDPQQLLALVMRANRERWSAIETRYAILALATPPAANADQPRADAVQDTSWLETNKGYVVVGTTYDGVKVIQPKQPPSALLMGLIDKPAEYKAFCDWWKHKEDLARADAGQDGGER